MYQLNTIKFQPTRSAKGNVTITKTVMSAISALGQQREMMTAGDVAYVINRNVHSDEQVTEKQVETVMSRVAADYANGYRYNAFGRRNFSSKGFGFYQYK